MITLDPCVVIAHLYPADRYHHEATELLRRSVADGFLMHSLNVTEVLAGGAKAGRAREMLTDLEAIGIQVADRPADEPLRLASLRADCGLRLPDCCALDTAPRTGSALATFDDALAEAASQRHIRVAPATA